MTGICERYVGKHVCLELWDSGETYRHYMDEVLRFELDAYSSATAISDSSTHNAIRWHHGSKRYKGRVVESFKTRSQLMTLSPFQAGCNETEYVLKVQLNPEVSGSVQQLGTLTGVIFPRGAVPMVKQQVVYLTREFLARSLSWEESLV